MRSSLPKLAFFFCPTFIFGDAKRKVGTRAGNVTKEKNHNWQYFYALSANITHEIQKIRKQ